MTELHPLRCEMCMNTGCEIRAIVDCKLGAGVMNQISSKVGFCCHSQSSANPGAVLDECETFDIIRFLKIRYGKEESIMDALENVEDEVLAVQREQKER